jgi:hypothetical protein
MWMVDCTAVSTGSAAGTAVSGMVEGDETSDPDAALEGAVPGDDSF